MIQFSKADIGEEEIEAMNAVMRSGWLAAGKETAAFEDEFSTYISPPNVDKYYCIFTNSCTSALKMAYKWVRSQGFVGIDYPINTFCATYSAAAEVGLITNSVQLSFGSYDTFGNEIPAAKAMIAKITMHYGGVKDETPCLIEDSAHRIEPNDPLVGRIRCYSFYVTKNMTTVQGGMFVTDDKEIYEKARLYWKDGLSTSTSDRLNGKPFYEVKAMAGGYDSNDVFAALGRVQLKRLPDFTARRNDIRDTYNKAFGQTWAGNHLYPYFVNSSDDVEPFIGRLRDLGIQASYHYPGTGWNGVSLPIYPLLTDSEVEQVIKAVHETARILRTS